MGTHDVLNVLFKMERENATIDSTSVGECMWVCVREREVCVTECDCGFKRESEIGVVQDTVRLCLREM